MLRHFITVVHKRKAFVRPRIMVCVPSGITQVEKRAVREAAESAGARQVFFIEEPMAAAIGAGHDKRDPKILTVDSEEIMASISDQTEKIVGTVHIALEQTPPKLAADIADKGIVLTGGGGIAQKYGCFTERKTKTFHIHR